MKKALILCTGNSCRSQMAQGLWNNLGEGRWKAVSAGSKPAGFVHPLAIQVMKDIGIDISKNKSRHIEEFSHEQFDLVVTVCDRAKRTCPTLPGAPIQHHWPFDDPALAEGSEEQRRKAFVRVRDAIREQIETFLANE